MPRSGPEGKAVNSFSVWITVAEENLKVWCHQAGDQGVVGKRLDNGTYSIEVCVPYASIDGSHVEIQHWYGLDAFHYDSIRQYVLEGLSGYDFFKLGVGRLRQSFFNRKPLIRLELMSLLRQFVKLTNAEPSFKTAPHSLVAHVSGGMRTYLHPDHIEATKHYRLLLDALVERGDLHRDHGGNYSLAPKALITLAQFEHDERRHGDNTRSANRMLLLTVALIGVGLLQAWATWMASK
ncbi:MAG TPA: hypothetical protein VN634_15005 [Candidatus Limnocylindrales bacterium]|nr:hypothetical protein [Candidatus Limnocylindrales bacterium]